MTSQCRRLKFRLLSLRKTSESRRRILVNQSVVNRMVENYPQRAPSGTQTSICFVGPRDGAAIAEVVR
jgi:hypothetical protein